MATPGQEKAATRKLAHWIENESKIVTYRTISREVGCHVNVAKNLLLAHYEAHPDLAPTYLLTGPLLCTSTLTRTELAVSSPSKATQSLRDMGKGMVRIVDMDERSEGERNSDDGIDADEEGEEGNDKGAEVGHGGIGGGAKDEGGAEWQGDEVDRWGVVLTGQETLGEKKKLFEEATLSVHIYALAPAPVKDPAQYLIPNLELHSHANYFNPAVYGTITGEAFRPAPHEKKPVKTGALSWGTKVDAKDAKKEVKDGGKGKEAAKKVDAKKDASKELKKELSKEVKKEGPKVDKKPGSLVGPSSKPRTSQSKKRTITSDTEEDEPEERPASSKSKPAVASSTSKSLKSEPTSSTARREDLAALEAMVGMDVDMSDDEPEEIPKPKAKVEMTQATGKKSASGRKIRRVKKTKREVDSKGYNVSKDYWSEESYSGESEAESQPKAKPAAASSKSQPVKPQNSASSVGSGSGKAGTQGSGAGAKKAASKPAAGQSTLKSFFQKK